LYQSSINVNSEQYRGILDNVYQYLDILEYIRIYPIYHVNHWNHWLYYW